VPVPCRPTHGACWLRVLPSFPVPLLPGLGSVDAIHLSAEDSSMRVDASTQVLEKAALPRSAWSRRASRSAHLHSLLASPGQQGATACPCVLWVRWPFVPAVDVSSAVWRNYDARGVGRTDA
jgi:hypothetical protein